MHSYRVWNTQWKASAKLNICGAVPNQKVETYEGRSEHPTQRVVANSRKDVLGLDRRQIWHLASSWLRSTLGLSAELHHWGLHRWLYHPHSHSHPHCWDEARTRWQLHRMSLLSRVEHAIDSSKGRATELYSKKKSSRGKYHPTFTGGNIANITEHQAFSTEHLTYDPYLWSVNSSCKELCHQRSSRRTERRNLRSSGNRNYRITGLKWGGLEW